MTTDWKKEVEAKAFEFATNSRAISTEDALALLERCRVETLEEVLSGLDYVARRNDDLAHVQAEIEEMVRALKTKDTQRKKGGEE